MNRQNVPLSIKFLIVIFVLFMILLFDSCTAHAATKWNGPVQCSYYTLAENGPVTASGIRMTNKSMGVAVPMEQVVSKKRWKKGSKSFKRTHFYYGEKVKLKHGKYICTVKIVDCGGFGRYGCYYKGKWRKRLFDLQPAVKRKLHCGDVSILRWKIVK